MKKLLALMLVIVLSLSLIACSVSEEQVEEYAGKYYKDDAYAKSMLDYGRKMLSADDASVIDECARLVKKLKKSPDVETARDVAFRLAILSIKNYSDPETNNKVEEYSKKALSFLQKETKITMDAVPWWSINKYRSVRDLYRQGKFSGESSGLVDWIETLGEVFFVR